jgi:hypothetical protein
MRTRIPFGTALAAGLLGGVLGATAAVEGPARQPAAPPVLVVVDGTGKEHKVTGWKFTAGTRHLSWLAPAPPDKKPDPPPDGKKGARSAPGPKPPAGPEALEFRDDASTNPAYVDGVLTLVPLDHVRDVEYDNQKNAVTVRVHPAAKAGDDLVLQGTTKYKNINKMALEAEVDKGELGVAAVKFLGGVPAGVRALRFPPPKPLPEPPAGRRTRVVTNDKQKTAHDVTDLRPLYRQADGSERLESVLLFKKTLKLDLARIQKLRPAEGRDPDGTPLVVTLKEGGEETYTALKNAPSDGPPAVLEGLLGRVSAGYKLFPLHTLAEVVFDLK